MTNEEWKQLETELTGTYGRAELLVDGYKITLVKEISHKEQRLYTVVYVDKKIRVEWLCGDCEIGRRFMCHGKRSVFPKKKIEQMIKKMGKKAFAKFESENPKLFYTETYSPLFSSFRTLKSQLVKNNQSIQLISCGYGQGAD